MSERTLFIGVGGCGLNTVERLIKSGLRGRFLCIDSDRSHLNVVSEKALKVPLSRGFDLPLPEEQLSMIREELRNTSRVFLFAGIGGRTGSMLAPYISEMREMDVYATYPFMMEKERVKTAQRTLPNLRGRIRLRLNDALAKDASTQNLPMSEAFKKVDGDLYAEIKKSLDG